MNPNKTPQVVDKNVRDHRKLFQGVNHLINYRRGSHRSGGDDEPSGKSKPQPLSFLAHLSANDSKAPQKESSLSRKNSARIKQGGPGASPRMGPRSSFAQNNNKDEKSPDSSPHAGAIGLGADWRNMDNTPSPDLAAGRGKGASKKFTFTPASNKKNKPQLRPLLFEGNIGLDPSGYIVVLPQNQLQQAPNVQQTGFNSTLNNQRDTPQGRTISVDKFQNNSSSRFNLPANNNNPILPPPPSTPKLHQVAYSNNYVQDGVHQSLQPYMSALPNKSLFQHNVVNSAINICHYGSTMQPIMNATSPRCAGGAAVAGGPLPVFSGVNFGSTQHGKQFSSTVFGQNEKPKKIKTTDPEVLDPQFITGQQNEDEYHSNSKGRQLPDIEVDQCFRSRFSNRKQAHEMVGNFNKTHNPNIHHGGGHNLSNVQTPAAAGQTPQGAGYLFPMKQQHTVTIGALSIEGPQQQQQGASPRMKHGNTNDSRQQVLLNPMSGGGGFAGYYEDDRLSAVARRQGGGSSFRKKNDDNLSFRGSFRGANGGGDVSHRSRSGAKFPAGQSPRGSPRNGGGNKSAMKESAAVAQSKTLKYDNKLAFQKQKEQQKPNRTKSSKCYLNEGGEVVEKHAEYISRYLPHQSDDRQEAENSPMDDSAYYEMAGVEVKPRNHQVNNQDLSIGQLNNAENGLNTGVVAGPGKQPVHGAGGGRNLDIRVSTLEHLNQERNVANHTVIAGANTGGGTASNNKQQVPYNFTQSGGYGATMSGIICNENEDLESQRQYVIGMNTRAIKYQKNLVMVLLNMPHKRRVFLEE